MPIRNFAEAKEYLESLLPKGREDYEKIGLARIGGLLDELGNPQDSYPTIHVGGTAGKGSTATMIAAILQVAGYRVGLHVSPHLEDMRERMQINGRLVSDKKFAAAVSKVRAGIGKVEGSKHGRPSYFEALLAATFECFRAEAVDVAVIEVGMGGRLDGTNVINPKVAVITNIGMDHMEFLGNSIEEIAIEKAGILKKGIDVVTGVTQPTVTEIVKKRADALGCRLDLLGSGILFQNVRKTKKGSVFDLSIGGKTYRNLPLSLMGLHQVGNAALAVDAALLMNDHGFKVGAGDIRKALGSVSVPCRFEVVKLNPTVILDGAHNPMKIDSLVETLRDYYGGRDIVFVFAAKKDKRVGEMIGKLSRIASKFYFTSFAASTDFGKRMSYKPRELDTFTDIESEVVRDPLRAFRKAIDHAGADGIVCATGSLYLTGELRSQIRD